MSLLLCGYAVPPAWGDGLDWEPLKIANAPVQLFRPDLRKVTQLESSPDGSLWRLRFFAESIGACRIAIRVWSGAADLVDGDARAAVERDSYGRLRALAPEAELCFRLFGQRLPEAGPEALRLASRVLRGSETLPSRALLDASDTRFYFDRTRVLVDLSGPGSENHLRRLACAMALAAAYQRVVACQAADTDRVVAQLSSGRSSVDEKAALTVVEAWQLWQAQHQYRYPVQMHSVLIAELYARVAQEFRLAEELDEVNVQSQRVLEALRARRLQSELAAADRSAWRMNFIATCIALLGLLSVVEITPDKVGGFVSAWGHWLGDHVRAWRADVAPPS